MKFLTRITWLVLGVLLAVGGTAFAVPTIFDGLVSGGTATLKGKRVEVPVAVTCADSGNGSAAACTLTPTAVYVNYTCSDTDTCAITLSETGALSGQVLEVTNVSANSITFTESAGVQELPATLTVAQWQNASFRYTGTTWVQNGAVVTGNVTGNFAASGGVFSGANSESMSIGVTDATFLLHRNNTGIVTLTASDDDTTAALTVKPGGAAAMVVGGASTTALTVTTDGTGTAEVVLPTSAIDATEITDITRSVHLPIAGWVPCAGQGIWTTDGTDTKPNLTAVNTALAITYDATGGTVDTGTVCTSFRVPDDYISGGAFVARITQGGATVTNIETWSCDVSQNGLALVGANAANLTNQTAVQTSTSTPTVTYAAGDSVGVVCKQGNGSADDTVNILSVAWTYTASE